MSNVTDQELLEFRAQVTAWFRNNAPADSGFLLPETFMEVGTDQQFEFLRDWQRKVYEAVAKMFEWIRTRVGFYGSTPAYWPVFEAHGLEDLGHKLNDMSNKGLWEEMKREISDDVVHLFAAVGRYDELVDVLSERFGDLVDIVTLPPGTPADVVQNVRAVPKPCGG